MPFFAESLARYDRQQKMVLEIIEKRPLGLLLVDGTKLKHSLIPNPLRCLDVRPSFHYPLLLVATLLTSDSRTGFGLVSVRCLGECETQLTVFIPFYLIIIIIIIYLAGFFLEKEGIHLPFRSVLIIGINIVSFPVVFSSLCIFS